MAAAEQYLQTSLATASSCSCCTSRQPAPAPALAGNIDADALHPASAEVMCASAPTAALVGSLQLLCPQPWQQRVVLLLVEEPSVLGMLKLLQQLPGLALQADQQHQQHRSQQGSIRQVVRG